MDIRDTITDLTVGITELSSKISAEININLLKHMQRLNYEDCDDPFLKELIIVEQILPLLEIVENYCISNPNFTEIDSDCGMFRIHHVNENCVYLRMKYIINNFSFWYDTAVIHFSDINDGNHVNQDKFYYSPMNRGMNVLDCTEYRLDDSLKHDEAWYFQKLTQVDLPPEEYFVEVERTLDNLWNGNFVSLTINMDRILNSHIDAYTKLVQKMEDQNAEHN